MRAVITSRPQKYFLGASLRDGVHDCIFAVPRAGSRDVRQSQGAISFSRMEWLGARGTPPSGGAETENNKNNNNNNYHYHNHYNNHHMYVYMYTC